MPRGGSAGGGGGLYVVYAREADAAAAIRGMGAGGVDGKEVKVGLATTRYCDEFLAHGTLAERVGIARFTLSGFPGAPMRLHADLTTHVCV